MALQNLDKVGIGYNLEGKPCFVQKVQNPQQAQPSRSVGKVVTYSSRVKQAQDHKRSSLQPSQNQPVRKRYKTTSAASPGSATMLGGNVSTSAILPASIYLGVLDGILGRNDWQTKHRIYRDIYTYDIAGALVDIIATLPYSDFNLVGVSDEKILQVYMDTINDLRLVDMLPSITTDYLVMGTFVGSLGWNKTKNRFTTMVPHDLDYCEIYDLGIAGVDPVIDVRLSEHYKDILGRTGDRFDRMKKQLPDYIVNAANSEKIELDPFYTLYVPRRGITSTFSDSDQEAITTAGGGNSYFNRILTIYLLEKALIKGTIESAQRRQRAITHITAGTDDWVPNDQELADLSELFLSADLDPISAQVVTRSGVEANSIKSGDDFWKWNDIFDFTESVKLKALGANESLLSGDASFNTLDAALSSFMDSISRTRDIITNATYYNKICPIIAYNNGFKNNNHTSVISSLVKKNSVYGANNYPEIQDDISSYIIPTIEYTKNLKPEIDKDYLDILQALEEKGIPIPLRLYAAAGGENIDQLISSLDDDNNLRMQIAEKKKDLIDDSVKDHLEKYLGFENIEDLLPSPDGLEAKLKTLSSDSMGSVNRHLKARNLEHLNERYSVREYDSSGHRRYLTSARKKQLTEKIHNQMAEALAENGKRENAKIAR